MSFKKLLHNGVWLLVDSQIKMVAVFIATIFLARYLGVADFGKLNFVVGFVGFFLPFATLGLDQIIIKEYVEKKNDSELIGTAFLLRIVISFVLTIAAPLIASAIYNDADAVLYITILSYGFVVQSFFVTVPYFESQFLAKYIAYVRISVYITLLFVRIFMVYMGCELIEFIYLIVIEQLCIAIGILLVYKMQGSNPLAWRFNMYTAKSLLSQSWPLVLSGLSIVLYMRIDQAMLKYMVGDEAVGYYSAALRISEASFIVSQVITKSFYPKIVALRGNIDEYKQSMQILYEITLVSSCIIMLFMCLLSDGIIDVFYGDQYVLSADVLFYMAFIIPVVFFSVAKGPWTICEGRQKFNMLYTFLGMLLNVLLNYLLIPVYGVEGAVIATLLSQIAVNLGFPLWLSKDRLPVYMFFRSIMFLGLRGYAK